MTEENSKHETIVNSKTSEINEKEYSFINQLFDDLETRGMIVHLDSRKNIKTPLIQMIEFFSLQRGINNIQELFEEEIEETREHLRKNLTQLLAERTKALQGNLTEYHFWKIKQKLEEALLQDNPHVFKNIFGIKPKSKAEKKKYNYKTKYDFSSALYLDMGLYSGAFAIADKAEDNLIVQYNWDYQKEDYRGKNEGIPFIEIPTRYNYSIYEAFRNANTRRKVMDAMYISLRQEQSLRKRTKNSPEFYHHMPNLISRKAQTSLLLFEKAMSKDGFKFVYCTVGEVLFHLYAWRMLVRKIQFHGINHEVNIEDDNFARFNINNYDFWLQVKGTNLPGDDWIKALEKRFKNEIINNEEDITLDDQWKAYKKDVHDDQNYPGEFRMIHEYETMGLTKFDEYNKLIFTRSFLEFVRYTIHVAQKKLGWKIDEVAITDDMEDEDGMKVKVKDHILRSLHRIERRLDIYYSAPKNIPNTHGLYPTIENLQKFIVIKEDKEGIGEKEYIIEECFRIIAKQYLLKKDDGKPDNAVPVKELLKRLHQRCRFPIIPYYFDLAVGDVHHPKEHLVFCLWNSKDNQIELESYDRTGTIKESGVVFVSLTVNPIWTIKPEYHLMKNGKSIHCTAELSEESYIRIHRLYDFFRFLATPIVDKVFYGSLIKKAQRHDLWEREISAFSHEIGKISTHLFRASVFSVNEMYGNNEDALQYLAESVNSSTKFTIEEVKQWGIIPNRKRFDSWSLIFNMWAGDNKTLITGNESQEKTLKDIIEICSSYAKKIHVASTTLKNASKEMNEISKSKEIIVEKIRKYQRVFEGRLKRLSNLVEITDPETLRICKNNYFSITNNEEISASEEKNRKVAKNAFLRILMAIIVNIHEHTMGDFILRLSKEGDYLTCTFYNKYAKDSDDEPVRSQGTKPVIESCLNQISYRNRLLAFEEDIKVGKEIKKELELSENECVWRTEVEINISKILSNEKH